MAAAGDRGALSRLRVSRGRRAAVSPAADAGTEVASAPVLSFRCRAHQGVRRGRSEVLSGWMPVQVACVAE